MLSSLFFTYFLSLTLSHEACEIHSSFFRFLKPRTFSHTCWIVSVFTSNYGSLVSVSISSTLNLFVSARLNSVLLGLSALSHHTVVSLSNLASFSLTRATTRL